MASADSPASQLPHLVVWDFDETVLRIHAYGLRLTPEDVATRELESDVADLPFFRACVAAALAEGHAVAIASFGLFPVIEAYLARVCPGVFTRANVSTPSCVGVTDGCSVPTGKVPQLDLLLSQQLLGGEAVSDRDRQRVVFFDDSAANVAGTLAAGYRRSYLVPRGGFTRQAWRGIAKAEDAALFGDAERLVS